MYYHAQVLKKKLQPIIGPINTQTQIIGSNKNNPKRPHQCRHTATTQLNTTIDSDTLNSLIWFLRYQ